MRNCKILSIFILFMLLATLGQSLATAQEPQPKILPDSPQPRGGYVTAHPYRWEKVIDNNGTHWLAVWSGTYGHNQHYVPGDWQTCYSGYGCISSWTWWLSNPESKLGVPGTWRSIHPGAKNLNNYTATVYMQ